VDFVLRVPDERLLHHGTKSRQDHLGSIPGQRLGPNQSVERAPPGAVLGPVDESNPAAVDGGHHGRFLEELGRAQSFDHLVPLDDLYGFGREVGRELNVV
jgi:hypothetical protein